MNVNVKNYKLQNINKKKFLLRHNLDELGRLDMSTVDQSEILDVWGSETCQDFIGQLLGIELYHVIEKVLCYSTEKYKYHVNVIMQNFNLNSFKLGQN